MDLKQTPWWKEYLRREEFERGGRLRFKKRKNLKQLTYFHPPTHLARLAKQKRTKLKLFTYFHPTHAPGEVSCSIVGQGRPGSHALPPRGRALLSLWSSPNPPCWRTGLAYTLLLRCEGVATSYGGGAECWVWGGCAML